MAEVTCPSCSATLPPGFKFCGQCGTKLPTCCPSCGAVVPDDFRFCGRCGTQLDSDAAPPTTTASPHPAPSPEPRRSRDERRQVSVLFADVSGFTKMSDRLDAEEVHAVMNEVFTGLGRMITDEGGHIDKYIGDNVMALFGAPIAHDDDPARACRAAVGMQAFLRDYSRRNADRLGVVLKMRIGINDGLVVAGGVGSDVKMQYSVMGDSVNIASRLESSAPPGSVLVSEGVYRATRDLFDFGPMQHLTVKGKPQPIAACELLGERHAVLCVGDTSTAESPLFGRHAELEKLIERLRLDEDDFDGDATVVIEPLRLVAVTGDKGVGKSRLVQEAIARIADAYPIIANATAATTMRPFGLVRRIVNAIVADHAGASRRVETQKAFADALRDMTPTIEPYIDALWYVCAPSHASVAAPDTDPLVLRRTSEMGFAALLRAFASRRSGAIVFADTYELADEASATLLRSLSDSDRGLPLPIVLATRRDTGCRHDIGDNAIRLDPLDDAAATAMFDALLRGATLPDDLRGDLLRRAQGVPLFVTELVRALEDSGAIRVLDNGVSVFEATASGVALPGSLRSAMLGRVDRLEAEQRELLYQCSVQGVEFDAPIAEYVRRDARWAGPDVAPMLTALTERGVVTPAAAGSPRRAFAQELMQQACYETLLKRDRQALHARTADALVALADDEARVSPTRLAFHEERAARWANAAAANLRAGDRAAEMYLNDEAMRHYDAAIEQVGRSGQSSATVRRIAARAHGGAARVNLLQGAYADAIDRAESMRTAAGDDERERDEANRVEAAARARTGDTDAALRLLKEVTADAPTGYADDSAGDDAAGDTYALAWHELAQLHQRGGRHDEAMRCITACRGAACIDTAANNLRADLLEGLILHTRGEFDDATALYQRAHDTAERIGNLSQLARAANNLGTTARDQGDYVTARRHYDEALETWTRMGDAEGAAGAHNNLGNVAMSLGDFDAASEHYQACLRAAKRIGNVRGVAMAHANLGLLALERNDGDMTVHEARTALATLDGLGDDLLEGLVTVVLAEGMAEIGDLDGADRVFARVLERYTMQTHPLAVLGATRGRGGVSLMRGDVHPAVQLLAEAADGYAAIRRAHEEARTRLRLARALLSEGRDDDALAAAKQAATLCETIHAHRDGEEAAELVEAIGAQQKR